MEFVFLFCLYLPYTCIIENIFAMRLNRTHNCALDFVRASIYCEDTLHLLKLVNIPSLYTTPLKSTNECDKAVERIVQVLHNFVYSSDVVLASVRFSTVIS